MATTRYRSRPRCDACGFIADGRGSIHIFNSRRCCDPAAPAASRVLRKFNRHAALVLGADQAFLDHPADELPVKSDHVTLDLKHHDSKKASKKRSVAAAFAMEDEDLDRPHGVQWSDVDVEQALTNKAGIDALISLDRNVASVLPHGLQSPQRSKSKKWPSDVRAASSARRGASLRARRSAKNPDPEEAAATTGVH